jgi:hypothetical protein
MTSTVILTSLGIGAAFGAILHRVQVSNPDRIYGTLTLRDLTVLKFMLLAIGVGAVGIGGLTALGLAHLKIKTLPLLAVAGGGLVFGVGFAVAGYCPGTCLVGAAEGRRDAVWTFVGGLAGALGYALVHPWARAWLVAPIDLGKPTLASWTGLGPGITGALFGAGMIALALLLPARPGRAAQADRAAADAVAR